MEEHVVEWSGTAYRQVFAGTDVLRANTRGARWNPPDVEAIYGSLKMRTATAEVDHLISRQPVPIRRPRVNFEASQPTPEDAYLPLAQANGAGPNGAQPNGLDEDSGE